MIEHPFDPPPDAIRHRATLGVVSTGAAQGFRFFVQLASAILLSRLLTPSDFGLVAMAAAAVVFIMIFQELGLTEASIQKDRLTQSEISSLFWIGLGAGGLSALALIMLSPLLSWYYGDVRVGTLASAMGLQLVLNSMAAQHTALLNRRMEFGTLAIIDACAALGGFLTSIFVASFNPSYWALFWGALAGTAISLACSWFFARWVPSPPWRSTYNPSLLKFGSGLTGFVVANYFARNLDTVLIGRYAGDQALGLYDRAYKLLLLPLQQVTNPLARVMLPTLARLTEEPQRYRRVFLRVQRHILLVTVPGVAFMIGTSDRLVPFLLGPQWTEAAPIFAALGFAGLIQPLNNPSGWLFMSQGRTREFMSWGVFGAATCIVAFVAGLPFGPFGVAVAYAASEYVRTPILWWYVTRRGPVHLPDITAAVPHIGAGFASVGTVYVLGHAQISPLPLDLLAGFLCSYAVSIGLLLLFADGRETLSDAVRTARSLLVRQSLRPGAEKRHVQP